MSRIVFAFFIVACMCANLCSGKKRPVKCEPNAKPTSCGKLCEPTCKSPREKFCKPARPELCKIECRCQRGYVRDTETGDCVNRDQCYNGPRDGKSGYHD